MRKGTYRLHLPLEDIEKADQSGYLQLWKKGHAWFEWKIGNRVILNDHKFRFDRFQMRLTEIQRVLSRDDNGNFKVWSRFVMEKME